MSENSFFPFLAKNFEKILFEVLTELFLCGISAYLRGDTEGRGVILQRNHKYF